LVGFFRQFGQLLRIRQAGAFLAEFRFLFRFQVGSIDFAHLVLQQVHAAGQFALVAAEVSQFAANFSQLPHQGGHPFAQGPQFAVAVQQLDMLANTHQRQMLGLAVDIDQVLADAAHRL
jgi:hypothetical protein